MVRRYQWLSSEEFLDLLGATNLIPGPNSTEMAIHIGHRKAGWKGLLVAGSCFIVPAVLIVTVLAWVYVQYGSTPQMNSVLYGIKPVIIAVVFQSLFVLGRSALKTSSLAGVGITAVLLLLLKANEFAILLGAGAAVGTVRWLSTRGAYRPLSGSWTPLLFLFPQIATGASVASFGLWSLFFFFLKTGSVLFGSGYVLLAFLRADLVERWHWLSEAQLLDAIAVGQMTPGPLFTTATFVGYLLGGLAGAFVATVGIFLPAFFFVAISGPLLPKLRRSPAAGGFLDGVNVASLALMVVVTYYLGLAAWVDLTTVVLTLAGGATLLFFRPNSVWIVLGGAVAGLLLGGPSS